MEKVVWCSQEEAEELYKKFGIANFNSAPANWEEVDEEWLATKSTFRTYGFKYTWFQQITNLPNEKRMLDVHCFGSYDSTGFAINTDYYGKKVRYFKFAGCKHEFRSLTEEEMVKYHQRPGRCYHVSICDKCNFIYAVDSSD
jgi:hypothetical protein